MKNVSNYYNKKTNKHMNEEILLEDLNNIFVKTPINKYTFVILIN